MLVRAAVRLGDGGLCRLPTMRTEKVDRGDLVQAFAQAAHIRRRDILALTQRARLACQLLIVGVTRSVEHSAQLRIAHAADKARFEDVCGESFESLREDTFAWLKTQELALFPFIAGAPGIGTDALVVAPANAGFFALGLALLDQLLFVAAMCVVSAWLGRLLHLSERED